MGGVLVSRRMLVLVVCALLASSCARAGTAPPVTTGGKYGSGVNTNFGGQASQAPSGSQAQTNADGGQKIVSGPSRTLPPDYGGGGTGGTTVDLAQHPTDRGSLGENAYFYLNRKVPKLTVEIDAVKGMGPKASTINLIRQRLGSVVDKPGGVNILPTSEVVAGRSEWSTKDAAAAEERYRSHRNSDQEAVIYLLFVDGCPPGGCNDHSPIGIAYTASSDVIYQNNIRGNAGVIVTAEKMENSVVVHEIGHLLSLVNVGYRSPRKHEDANHPGHSNDVNSVMYWAVDISGVGELLGGHTAPPTDFDADDRADLADVKAGRLQVR